MAKKKHVMAHASRWNKLRNLIGDATKAAVEASWAGSQPLHLQDVPRLEAELAMAKLELYIKSLEEEEDKCQTSK